MNKKLTLTIKDEIVKKAKEYAADKNISLSKMVEVYFCALVEKKRSTQTICPPITNKLTGILKDAKTNNEKDILAQALIEKHL